MQATNSPDGRMTRLRRAAACALVLLAVLAAATGGARAEGRWALVLGIAEYADAAIPDLDNTINDARTMAAALNDMGFSVYYLENATKADVDATLARMAAEQPSADVGLVYYAGHGLQLEGVNYLLPADIAPAGDSFLEEQGISVSRLIQDLRAMNPASMVVILDSCRNSPFEDRAAFGTGLALVDAPENAIIAYSTAPGEVALDGSGPNSPYTAALASVLDGPQQDIRDVLRLVRAKVRLATGGVQTPWFVDNSKAAIVVQPRPAVMAPEEAADLLGDEVSIVATFWRTIETSSDPRDFALFAELNPETELADIARRQVTLLETEQAPSFPLMDLGVPDPNPEVPGGLGALITECDLLATGPSDALALAEPVPHDLVNTRAALRACLEAVSNDPENGRLVGMLGRVLRLDNRFEEALHYAERSAALGNPTAYGGIAEIYRLGLGVPVDQVRAAAAARSGAMMGSNVMQLLLALHYREGWGVPQSFNEARRWMEISGRGGFPPAATALGDMYRRGQLGPADPAKALEYYRQAAALDHTDAINVIGLAYMKGEGVPQDIEEGIRWLSRASEEGNPYAAYHLGRAFQSGQGVEKDPAHALAYFRLSAQRNFLGAYIQIGDVLQAGGEGLEPALPEAYANYVIAREAAILRDTIESAKERDMAQARIDEVAGRMSPEEVLRAEQIAHDWIEQYGLLDFNLVHE